MTQHTDVDILTQAGKPVVPGSVTGIGRAPGAETEIPRPRAHPLHGRLRGPGPAAGYEVRFVAYDWRLNDQQAEY